MSLRLQLIKKNYETSSPTAAVSKWLPISLISLFKAYFQSRSWALQSASKRASSNSNLRWAAKSLPGATASVSRSGREPERTRGVHPLHKCSLQGFGKISSRLQQHTQSNPQRRDHVLDDISEHREKKTPRKGNSGL